MKQTIYGYIRVSTKEQCEERQLLALKKFPVLEKTFLWISKVEKISIDLNIKYLSEKSSLVIHWWLSLLIDWGGTMKKSLSSGDLLQKKNMQILLY